MSMTSDVISIYDISCTLLWILNHVHSLFLLPSLKSWHWQSNKQSLQKRWFVFLLQNPEKWLKPWHMATHLRLLSESFPINTNLVGFRWFSRNLFVLVLWAKVASALKRGRWSVPSWTKIYIVVAHLRYHCNLVKSPIPKHTSPL